MGDPLRPDDAIPESRLEFDDFICGISTSLCTTPAGGLVDAVGCAVERVRSFLEADCCALLSVKADRGDAQVLVAAHSDNVPSLPDQLKFAKEFPWSRHELLVERVPVRVPKIDDLPSEADVDRQSWNRMRFRSALLLPIDIGGKIGHLLLLGTAQHEYDWPDPVVDRLRVFGQMLVGAIERRKMHSAIRDVEERVTMVADSMDAGLWSLDCSVGEFWFSIRARTMFGYSPDEVIDRERFLGSIHSGDRELVRDLLDRTLRECSHLNVEHRIPLADSGVRWIVSRAQPRFDTVGEAKVLNGVSLEVTQQRSEAIEIRKNAERLDIGADLAGLGYYEVDFGAGSTYIDDRFRSVCGVPPHREAGLQPVEFWKERLHPDDRLRVLAERQRIHSGEIPEAAVEYRYLHPTRGEIWLQHLGRVDTRDAQGKALVTNGVLRDITQRKTIESDLQHLSQRLIRAHEEERALLARELHDDMSQRLAVMAIELERLEQVAQERKLSASLGSIRRKLVDLSEDVHSLAYQLHPSVLRELGLVEALKAECERIGRGAPLKFSLELEPSADVTGGDVALCLFRVAQAALSNVVRHAAASTVRIELSAMEDGIRLEVHDNGVGFDPATSGAKVSLGLSSMRERIRLLNGSFDVESAPGHGTKIIAWVPRAEAAQ